MLFCLDEMMGGLSRYMGHDAMTARLEVRYRKPVLPGSRLLFSAILQRQVKGILDIKRCANLEDESLVAEATGRMMVVSRPCILLPYQSPVSSG
jgi:acyl-coenzyme A thioesterase PaaI-like protein